MDWESSLQMIRDRLIQGVDFEIAGYDQVAAVGYRISFRHSDFDVAPFSRIDFRSLKLLISEGQPISIGATQFRVESSFSSEFLRAVKILGRISAISVTLQSYREIITLIGGNPDAIVKMLQAMVSTPLVLEEGTIVEGTREWGRKVGHAAKDLTGLREVTLTVDYLARLERSGGEEAFEAVCKKAIWPQPSLDDLRMSGIPPVVAFGIISCWRMIKQRPARNPVARLIFVRDLPEFVSQLHASSSLDEFSQTVDTLIKSMGRNVQQVVGGRIRSFAWRIHSPFREFRSKRDNVLSSLLAIDAIPEVDERWKAAERALSANKRSIKKETFELTLPTREAIPINEIFSSGHTLSLPPLNDVPRELGITGVEFGNYVRGSEGKLLSDKAVEALTVLRAIIGDWIVPLNRKGNLSLALGSRGKGKACAHYEPSLRVINLTKTHGDGSLAHEFAHFLDHMLAAYSDDGESRFLSARNARKATGDHLIEIAMRKLMTAILCAPRREKIVGINDAQRWFLQRYIVQMGFSPNHSPQHSYDLIVNADSDYFLHGREARNRSVVLVNSIAKYLGKAIDIEITYFGKSNFAQESEKLGNYWKRPEELFARAFESFIEDEALHRKWQCQYLVFGTKIIRSDCRGLPYPIGDEREQINLLMADLIIRCAAEFGGSS